MRYRVEALDSALMAMSSRRYDPLKDATRNCQRQRMRGRHRKPRLKVYPNSNSQNKSCISHHTRRRTGHFAYTESGVCSQARSAAFLIFDYRGSVFCIGQLLFVRMATTANNLLNQAHLKDQHPLPSYGYSVISTSARTLITKGA